MTGIEFIFFPVADMGLSFDFMLTTVGYFHYGWAAFVLGQGSFCSSPHPTSWEWTGSAPEAGKGHSWDSWPQLNQRIFQTTWRHAQHRAQQWDVRSDVVCLLKPLLHVMKLCLPGDGLTIACPCEVLNSLIPCFVFLACAAFAFPITLSFSQPMSFTFILAVLSSIPTRGTGRKISCLGLSCGLRLNYESKRIRKDGQSVLWKLYRNVSLIVDSAIWMIFIGLKYSMKRD